MSYFILIMHILVVDPYLGESRGLTFFENVPIHYKTHQECVDAGKVFIKSAMEELRKEGIESKSPQIDCIKVTGESA